MIREEFISGYCERSDMPPVRVEGERVYWTDEDYWCALPCSCEKEGCDGWAMIPPSGRGWHLYSSGPEEGRPSYEEAIAADMAWMEAKHPGIRALARKVRAASPLPVPTEPIG